MMLRLAVASLLAAALATNAGAAPFRIETGLPPGPPAAGAALPEDVPAWPTGLVHPYARLGDFRIGVRGDTFVSLRVDRRQGVWLNEFELSRVQLTGFFSYRALAGINVTLESIRSSSARSYYGIDGDSLLPRFKYAFVEATPLRHWISLRAGLIPDLLLPFAEASWDFRVQGTTGVERDSMFAPGDLGASLEVALPWALGSVGVSYTNGEGINLREQNNGKNTTVVLRLAPLRHRLPQLLLHLLYRDGSVGASPISDSRLAGGITYTGRTLGAGLLAAWALGYLGVGPIDAAHAGAWIRGELPYRFHLLARADLLWPDARFKGDVQMRTIAGVAYAMPAIARLVASYEVTVPFGTLAERVPSLEEHLLLFQVEGRL